MPRHQPAAAMQNQAPFHRRPGRVLVLNKKYKPLTRLSFDVHDPNSYRRRVILSQSEMSGTRGATPL